MARTQTASAQIHADRDQEVRHAEQELGAAESQVAQELQRLDATAGELLRRMQQLKSAASQAQLSALRDPELAGLKRRAEEADVPAIDVSAQRDEALRVRFEAVEARRSALDHVRKAVQSATAELARASEQVSADEKALARFESQAREEAAKRETVVEAPVPPPPPPPRATPAAAPATAPSREQPRRAQPRVRMQAAVDLHSESNFFTGFSTNISEGGLFIATVQTLEIGTEVDLNFTLGNGEKLSVRGVVRWTREINDHTPDIFPGVGIQFANLDASTAATIQRFVASREPMFFPE